MAGHTTVTDAPRQHDDRVARLRATAAGLLQDRAFIVAANRGPLSFTQDEQGQFQVGKGAGGVVTALTALGRYADPVWVAATLSAGDRARAAVAERDEIVEHDGAGLPHRLCFVAPPPTVYDRYYNTIANPLLWFLQHYLWDLTNAPVIDEALWVAWRDGYQPVNEQFADTIVATARQHAGTRPPLVLLHDYHLYLCPRLVRERLPAALVQHFVHIPWPAPDSWRVLPRAWRVAICAGLLGADLIGFQTPEHASNFLATCQVTLPEVAVDCDTSTVTYQGRTTVVRAYPIALDTEALRANVNAAATAEAPRRDDSARLIVRTDRAEPSKNIVRGFLAYRVLLEQHPEWRGRVTFLALLNPSRLGVPEYVAYNERVSALVAEINTAFGTADWQPIDLVFTDDYARALAALREYDVLLVNSLADGMNLVAKEGPLVNERDGVLILSEGTGAFAQLHDHALAIAPCDIAGTAAALHAALTMPAPERAQRSAALRATIEREDIIAWLQAQFDDLLSIATVPA